MIPLIYCLATSHRKLYETQIESHSSFCLLYLCKTQLLSVFRKYSPCHYQSPLPTLPCSLGVACRTVLPPLFTRDMNVISHYHSLLSSGFWGFEGSYQGHLLSTSFGYPGEDLLCSWNLFCLSVSSCWKSSQHLSLCSHFCYWLVYVFLITESLTHCPVA